MQLQNNDPANSSQATGNKTVTGIKFRELHIHKKNCPSIIQVAIYFMTYSSDNRADPESNPG